MTDPGNDGPAGLMWQAAVRQAEAEAGQAKHRAGLAALSAGVTSLAVGVPVLIGSRGARGPQALTFLMTFEPDGARLGLGFAFQEAPMTRYIAHSLTTLCAVALLLSGRSALGELPEVDTSYLATDPDGDGWCEVGPCTEGAEGEGDCEPMNSAVNPGEDEACDGIDNDCDGGAGEDEVDGDGDGHMACDEDECDDADARRFAGNAEVCDGVDNDCDEDIDEGAGDDLDGDSFTECGGDCDEGDSAIYPGAEELCDGVDSDCDGGANIDGADSELDADGDGLSPCEGDCAAADGSARQLRE